MLINLIPNLLTLVELEHLANIMAFLCKSDLMYSIRSFSFFLKIYLLQGFSILLTAN